MAEPATNVPSAEVEIPVQWVVRAELRGELHSWASTAPCPTHGYACVLCLPRYSPTDGLPSRELPGVILVGLGRTCHAAILLRTLEVPSLIVTRDDWTVLGKGSWQLLAEPHVSTMLCVRS